MRGNVRTRTFRELLLIGSATAILLGICMPIYAQQPGEATFKAKCAMCHGADGSGKTPMGAKLNIPNLRSPELKQKSVADLAQIISKGKNKMPAYEGKLTSAEISQLATYICDLK